VRIDATDIDQDSLERTRAARYKPPALAETPADVVRRWFRTEGEGLSPGSVEIRALPGAVSLVTHF